VRARSRAAQALADRAARDTPLTSPYIVRDLLTATTQPGSREVLIARTAANTPADPWVYFWHLSALHNAGADDAARTLAGRAADQMPATFADAVTSTLTMMGKIGADEAAGRLSERAARDVSLGPFVEPEALVRLLRSMDDGGHRASLADRIVRDFPLDDPATVGRLVRGLAVPDFEDPAPSPVARPVRVFGRAAHALALRAARETPVIDLHGICDLREMLRGVPDEEVVDVLVTRVVNEAAASTGLDRLLRDLYQAGDIGNMRLMAGRTARTARDVDVSCALLKTMDLIGADEARDELATRAAHEAPIVLPASGYSPRSTDRLLAALHGMGAGGPARTLAGRIAGLAPLDDPGGIARLLGALAETGYDEQARRLAGRAARDAVLTDPDGILDLVVAVGATGPASLPALALRAAQDVSVENATHAVRLVHLLRETGVPGAERTLLSRVARRHFGLYLNLAPPEEQERFSYGREPGGTPSAPWTWSTLP
jgi:hypothetical protein